MVKALIIYTWILETVRHTSGLVILVYAGKLKELRNFTRITGRK